jgi:aspartate kinase
MSASMMSSISSLSQLELRSGSPSPFQSSGRRSPTSPTTNAGNGEDGAGFHETVNVLKKGHLEAARATLRSGPLRDELEEEIERDCEHLRSFLYAAQVSARSGMRSDLTGES